MKQRGKGGEKRNEEKEGKKEKKEGLSWNLRHDWSVI